MRNLILDLCGGTGAWSRPFAQNGYDVLNVTLPNLDVREFRVTSSIRRNVWGVLAAPPCTHLSVARTKALTARDFEGALETVYACLRIIAECQYTETKLGFWAMENPVGLLPWFLGPPVYTFHPWQFGDPWQKLTGLWGNFNPPVESPTPIVSTEKHHRLNIRKLPRIPKDYVRPPGADGEAIARAITPPGFARAFYAANQRPKKGHRIKWTDSDGQSS